MKNKFLAIAILFMFMLSCTQKSSTTYIGEYILLSCKVYESDNKFVVDDNHIYFYMNGKLVLDGFVTRDVSDDEYRIIMVSGSDVGDVVIKINDYFIIFIVLIKNRI